MNEAILIIGLLCNINVNDVKWPKERKIECAEYYTNCLIGPNGVYLKNKLKECTRRRSNEIKQGSPIPN